MKFPQDPLVILRDQTVQGITHTLSSIVLTPLDYNIINSKYATYFDGTLLSTHSRSIADILIGNYIFVYTIFIGFIVLVSWANVGFESSGRYRSLG